MSGLFASITPNQPILDSAEFRFGSEPLGPNGSNLTIVLLSMNKVSLTIRLLRSITQHIPNFSGEILIGDNGSDEHTLETLRNYLASFPFRQRLLTFLTNHGVAGGRNRAFSTVTTDWILSLDNDIYLLNNPLPRLNRDIGLTGAHFLSLPLLQPDESHWYSFGGNLDVTYYNGKPKLAIRPELPPNTHIAQTSSYGFTDKPFFGSFIFGGASVLRLGTFNTIGGFDDNMFVGFEDIDFSLRVYKAGLRVACSTTPTLVHDHAKSTSDADIAYETVRYSRSLLRDSATYLEQKSGFAIWGHGEDSWLDEKSQFQAIVNNVSSFTHSSKTFASFATRPRLALVIDAYNWAFDNIAKQLAHHLAPHFLIDIFTLSELAVFADDASTSLLTTGIDPNSLAFARLLLIAPQYDLVHIFQKEFLLNYYSSSFDLYAKRLGISRETLLFRAKRTTSFTTAVYDHANTSSHALSTRGELFSKIIDGYIVSSERLYTIYANSSHIAQPHSVISDGVDLRLFYPIQLSRFSAAQKRSLVIGWAGNSQWGDSDIDHKGFNTIIEPTVRQLQQEGFSIELLVQDRNITHLSHDRMVDFYKQLDLYVCMSDAEGTPNPVLEAMACGVPVLSTDVGVVSTVMGPKQRSLLLFDRSIHGLKSMLQDIILNRDLLVDISVENQHSIRAFTWDNQTPKFLDFFSDIITLKRSKAAQRSTRFCMSPFENPGIEIDGTVRLCSAASAIPFREETAMGNVKGEGIGGVWQGAKYRAIRHALLTGTALPHFCVTCEYRQESPAWLLQLHVALHAYHAGNVDDQILDVIRTHAWRHDEYRRALQVNNIPPHPLPSYLTTENDFKPLTTLPESLLSGAALPIAIDFNTLNRCNVSCIMCPPALRFDTLKQPRQPYYRLTIDEFHEIVQTGNIRSVHFVGEYAEPLLNKDIFALIAAAKQRGLFTAITSNATALTSEFSARLLESGLDMLSISLHGSTREISELIMKRSSFDRVISNIQELNRLKRNSGSSRPELHFNFVSQLANGHQIDDFVRLAYHLNGHLVNVIHLIDGAPEVNKQDSLLNHPDLLISQLQKAIRTADTLGILLRISPAYLPLLSK